MTKRPVVVCGAIGALIAFIASGCLGQTPGDLSAAQAACAKVAEQLPAPVELTMKYDEASPATPFSRSVSPGDPALSAAALTAAQNLDGQNLDGAMAARFQRLAQHPAASWFVDASLIGTDLTAAVAQRVRTATAAGQTPVLVAYVMPLRDCGSGYSQGGASSARAYQEWMTSFIHGIREGSGGAPVGVVLEPDALAALDNLADERQQERLSLLKWASYSLAQVPGVAAYLDAGHSGWVPSQEMAQRLGDAGVSMARGFALNVSNFNRTDDEVAYGQQISSWLGGKSFVVDTSRNGNGPATGVEGIASWCNPPGRALGTVELNPSAEHVDAELWIKSPGQSDGACRPGQPPAGDFWPTYAEELMLNAGW